MSFLKVFPHMQFFASKRARLTLAAANVALPLLACAQTLQQRPPSTPTAQPEATAASPRVDASYLIPKGTSLQAEIGRPYSMKVGQSIEGKLIYPIYSNGKLAIPVNTLVRGKVVGLDADTRSRVHACLRGDFTPYHTTKVRFDELVLPTGSEKIDADTATGGNPVVHLTARGASPKRSFVSRQWAQAKSDLHARVADFTAPGKGDRALQFLYHQLPYHPERIEPHSAWSFELNAPLDVLSQSIPSEQAPAAASGRPEIWSVHALLENGLSSATARAGDSVQALVVEPVYDRDRHLVVPQGATLIGKVTAATAARSFGRNGKLRFTFQQVQFPEGSNRPVEGALAGAATEKLQNLSLDAEGTISPKNHASVIAPLLLTALAGRALDQDGNMTVDNGVASNGFGLVGRIVGITASNRNIAAGLGYYAASLSLYENFLRSGHDVVFPRDTRIEIETTPLRAPVLAPSGR
jgi:hypothetical protein